MADRLWNWDDPLRRCPAMKETRAANLALRDYARMSGRRSLRELLGTYRQQASCDSHAKLPTLKQKTLFSWSIRYDWVARVTRHDDIVYTLEEEACRQKWEERRVEIRDREYDHAEMLIEKAIAMLQYPIREVERVTDVSDDGKTVHKTIVMPAKWSFSTPNQLLDLASKLSRLAAEMETDRKTLDVDWQNAVKKLGLDPAAVLNEMARQMVEQMAEVEGKDV